MFSTSSQPSEYIADPKYKQQHWEKLEVQFIHTYGLCGTRICISDNNIQTDPHLYSYSHLYENIII